MVGCSHLTTEKKSSGGNSYRERVLKNNENNFLEVVEEYSDSEKWARISDAAYQQALELDWHEVLKPLQRIIPLE